MYNNELYHYGKPGMRWGNRKSNGPTIEVKKQAKTDATKPPNTEVKKSVSKKPKKTAQQHREAGVKHVGKALKILGANLERAHTLHDANRISKMVFPD